MIQNHWTEIFLPSLAAIFILIYHVYYYFQLKYFPMQTSIGITRHLRAFWVEIDHGTKTGYSGSADLA